MKIVILGSGLAGITAAEALSKSGRHDVTVATAESHGYYSRPRLSHGFALSDAMAAKIVLKPFAALAPGVRVLQGVDAVRIDRGKRRVELKEGEALDYDVLVLATGSAARVPPPLAPFRPHFVTLNSYADLLALRHFRAGMLAQGRTPRWAIVGGGLIGCEVASDLNKAGDAVTIFHREDRLIELQLTPEQSRALHDHLAGLGVEVRYDQKLEGLPHPYDAVLVATGFAPRIDLAKEAGLATARGIAVDDSLRTADPGIYAAGDVAEVGARLFPFVTPIRSQALWLAEHLEGRTAEPWKAPDYSPVMKIHGFRPLADPISQPVRV